MHRQPIRRCPLAQRLAALGVLLVCVALAAPGCGAKQEPVTIPVCDDVDVNCRCTVASWVICSHVCVDLRYDPANCGTCGHECGGGQVCLAGACTGNCGALTACDGRCVGDDDPLNCGSCGTTCRGGCKKGECVPAVPAGEMCTGGKTYCPGGCTDISSDVFNCGGCGLQCQSVSSDTCYQQADKTYWCCHGKLCNGVCKDVKNDPDNCGDCGKQCANSCSFGFCN